MKRQRFFVWLVFFVSGVLPLGLSAAQQSSQAMSHDCTMSQDLSLVQGRQIDHVDIHVKPIFEPPISGPFKSLYELANRLHISTRPETVENDLLFNSGDQLDQDRLAETERRLRRRRYYSEARVSLEECGAHSSDEPINVHVEVKDVWSLEPLIRFSKTGDEDSFAMGLEENNFLGLGKTLQYLQFEDGQRDGYFFNYQDPNTGYWDTQISAMFGNTSDGGQKSLSFVRPFESLITPWSFGFSWIDIQLFDRLYDRSTEVDRYGRDQQGARVFVGWPIARQDHKVTRFILGVTRTEQNFTDVPTTVNLAVVPDDFSFSTVFLELQWQHDHFKELSNLWTMNRIEDINFGLEQRLRFGIVAASPQFDQAVNLEFAAKKFWQFGERHYVQWIFSAASILELGEHQGRSDFYNGEILGQVNYFWQAPWLDRTQFYAQYREARVIQPFGQAYLMTGGNLGARAYPTRFQMGDRLQGITLEHRFYGQREWLSLFYLGSAVFYDGVHVWGESPVARTANGWLHSVGAGLRLTTNRLAGRDSGGSSVLHVDLAAPVGPVEPTDSIQFSVTIKRQF